jgi:anti-sigma regulatory factor (Ser/Thr protein kinase)
MATAATPATRGNGLLRIWQERGALVCEAQDRGWIEQPLVGRIVPEHGQLGGRGLWLANQLCDLVQIRCSAPGTVVRMRLS